MIETILAYIQSQIGAMDFTFSWTNFLEIAIIAVVLLTIYSKFIKNTQSEKFVKGAFFLVFLWIFSEILIRFDLKIIGVFLKSMVTLISLSLIVIFQPELRKLLGFLGQVDFISRAFSSNHNNKNNVEEIDVVKEIIESVKFLSKTHTGALIVFDKDNTAMSYFDVGTKLNADVSTELILTIFHPNTPLHDGAVVIKDDKILAAGVLLPLTEDPKLSWKYGTRHRAAIGMSEHSDAACLVVSEETGDVSMSMDGTLKKYDDLITLKNDLENILGYEKEEDDKKTIFKINNFIALRKNVNSTKGKV